jgi:hypothetical protein
MSQGTSGIDRARHVVIAVLAGLNAVGAAGGALGLAFGFLRLDTVSASRLPWGSTVLAGTALALLVAVPNAVLTVVAARRGAGTGPLSIGVGAVLVGWILVELAFIRELSYFHPVYIAVGMLLVWLGGGVIRTTGAVSWAALLSQLRDVLVDLPVFATSPAYRRWHLRWGATRTEVAQAMPGDDMVSNPSYLSTRAITIDAPPERVWPWLVQVGCRRAGFYSNDLIDNLGQPSARSIVPGLQKLERGQYVPMSPSPTPDTAFTVTSYLVPDRLLWSKCDSTWAWQLSAIGSGGTRLVTRIRAVYDWRRPAQALTGLVLMEFGDFAMMRRMLRGVKQRAESVPSRVDDPAGHAVHGI